MIEAIDEAEIEHESNSSGSQKLNAVDVSYETEKTPQFAKFEEKSSMGNCTFAV